MSLFPTLYRRLGFCSAPRRYKQGNYPSAVEHFCRALDLCAHVAQHSMVAWEPTLCNLGHAHRKSGELDDATRYYEMALALVPRRAATYAALGFTCHLRGDLDDAIDHYHKALGLKPQDAFASDMLTRALEEVVMMPPL